MSAHQLLARAFQDDPFIAWADADRARRLRMMASVFAGMLRYAERVGGHIYEPEVGSVHWRDGRASHMGVWDILASGTWQVAFMTPPAGWLRLSAHESAAVARVQRFVDARSAYLCTLGVEPSQTGRGHGGRLLERALHQMKDSWDRCVLRTEQPTNLPFYTRHGFRQIDEFVVEPSGLRCWAFSREL